MILQESYKVCIIGYFAHFYGNFFKLLTFLFFLDILCWLGETSLNQHHDVMHATDHQHNDVFVHREDSSSHLGMGMWPNC